jgi:hypothetical protein
MIMYIYHRDCISEFKEQTNGPTTQIRSRSPYGRFLSWHLIHPASTRKRKSNLPPKRSRIRGYCHWRRRSSQMHHHIAKRTSNKNSKNRYYNSLCQTLLIKAKSPRHRKNNDEQADRYLRSVIVTSRLGNGMLILFSWKVSHSASITSPRILVTPFSASLIQKRNLKSIELSPKLTK